MTEEQIKRIQDYHESLLDEKYGWYRDESCELQGMAMREVLHILELEVMGVNSKTMRKEDLDTRICDVIPYAKNTQTFREFIRSTEKRFGLEPAPLDTFNAKELNEYIEKMNRCCNGTDK